MQRALRLLLFVLSAATAQAQAPTTAPAEPLQVAAAADLKFALEEIATAYRAKASGRDLKISYGSSGSFFAQISNGAPFDLYLSADISYPRKLIEAGAALKGSEFLYAIGRLVVWVPNASKLDLKKLGMKALRDKSIQRIAIANPAHAPYGKAAEAAMRSLGVYDAVKDKLVLGENVTQAAQFVETGNADLGVLPLSLALAPPLRDEGRYWQVPAHAFPRMEQGGVLIGASKNLQAAKAFAEFVTGPDGRAILTRYGFELPAKK